MISIEKAENDAQINAVRSLLQAFVLWHRTTHVEDRALIDRYFDEKAFDDELRSLPGAYAPPKGALLVAYVENSPAGCVALHDLGDGICEMKRMFVPPAFQRRGIGQLLADRILAEARTAGYRTMRLDTSRRQHAAIALYERIGFRRVLPYYELPADLTEWLVFFECDL